MSDSGAVKLITMTGRVRIGLVSATTIANLGFTFEQASGFLLMVKDSPSTFVLARNHARLRSLGWGDGL